MHEIAVDIYDDNTASANNIIGKGNRFCIYWCVSCFVAILRML